VLEQHRDFGGAKTVWEAGAGEFAELLALEKSLEEQATALGNAGDSPTPQMLAKYDRDFERFEREGGYTFAPRVDAVLEDSASTPSSRALAQWRISAAESAGASGWRASW
jgi:ATPase components of ABC transporters with duplicated ATPase domains